MNKESKNTGRHLLILGIAILLTIGNCANLKNLLKPTSLDRASFKAPCKKHWKGKTIFIDFESNYSVWNSIYSEDLSTQIRDQLIEDIVEDGCFKVQDRPTGVQYLYKVGVRIGNGKIYVTRNGLIQRIQATFRIKTYSKSNNLITAKTRKVNYKAPMVNIAINDSQMEILENYAYNASLEIRKQVYQSFK